MAGRSVNVELRVKAQDEASKALDTVAKSLRDLGSAGTALQGGTGGVGKFVEDLGKNLGGLDALAAKFESNIDKIGRSEETLGKRLNGLTRTVDTQKAKLEELVATRDRYQQQLSKGFVGPVQPEINNKALKGLDKDIGGLSKSIEANLRGIDATIGKIADGREALRSFRTAQIDIESAAEKTTAELLKQEQALVKLAAAERAAGDAAKQAAANRNVSSTVNRVTGVDRAAVDNTGIRAQRQSDLERTFAPVFDAEDAKSLRDAAAAHAAFEAAAARGIATIRKEEAAFDSLQNYVQELRREFDRAGYAQTFLTRETAKLDAAVRKGILSQRDYAKALEAVKRKSEALGEQSNPTAFGLNPYQFQNLTYQINDVFTQLASGTSITQTLAQQGGQILQLFPKAGNSMVAAFRGAGAAGGVLLAVLVGIGLGIKAVLDEAEKMRTLNRILEVNADGAKYNAEALRDVATEWGRVGIAAEEASRVMRTLLREGFDQTRFEEFGAMAKGLSLVMGTDVPQAADLLAEALKGNLTALEELDRATNAFSGEQLDSIKNSIRQGDTAKALGEIYGVLSPKLKKAAEDQSEFAKAGDRLSVAWDKLKQSLGNNAFLTGLVDVFASLANGVASLVENINKLDSDKWYALVGANGFIGAATTVQASAPGKTDRQGVSNNAAVDNVNMVLNESAARYDADATLRRKTEEAALQGQVKSAQDIEKRLKALRERINEELSRDKDMVDASPAARNAYITQQVDNERLKLEEQLVAYKKRQADEAEREAKARASFDYQSKELLRQNEGFRSKAYWDVNAFRVGYGSDTVTRADGRVERVTAATTATRADAERDLERRIAEFTNVVKQQIGADRFGQFSSSQQAALVSIAYNYGELPKRILGAVEKGTIQQIATAVRGLRNDNGGVNAARRDKEAAILGAENLAVDQGSKSAAKEEEDKLEKYNTSLDERLDKEERSVANQKALVGLHGEALRAEQERQAVAEAIAQATDDLQRSTGNQNATLDQSQIDRITVDVRARLKLDEPKKVYDDLNRQLSSLEGYRGGLEQQLQTAQQTGDVGGVAALKKQIDEVDSRIKEAAANLLDFLNTPGNPESISLYGAELDNLILKLDALKNKSQEWSLTIGSATISARDFANAFTSTATNALDQFAQAVANGKNVIGSLWTAFRQFAADFLLQIAKMIQQQIIFNLVSGLLKSIGGAFGGSIGGVGTSANGFGAIAGMQAHGGGVIGMGATYGAGTGFRAVSPAMFANANRYHSGGIAGLKPGEVPSVLMRGEEVLTRDDPRHIMNGGGGSGGGNVKIVNTFDESDFFSKGANTKAGEKAILNLVRSNPRAFKAAMGGA